MVTMRQASMSSGNNWRVDMLDFVTSRIADLRQQLENVAISRRGETVIIVPGLGGSALRVGGQDLWLDVEAIREGLLVELAYDPMAPALKTAGAIDTIYLQLRLRLQLLGYDVVVHAYDWRRRIEDLGAELAARIAIVGPGRPVHVVAHSMGGLVARAAAALGAASSLSKLILLGTPNGGTYAAAQGIRGTHWVLRALSVIDSRNSASALATGVFNTWPSVYQQLPREGEVDFFDPRGWPQQGPQPRADLLRSSRWSRDGLVGDHVDTHSIVGHGWATVDGAKLGSRGFEYLQSDGGDGLVPASLAALNGYPSYFVPSGHIMMPNYQDVVDAVESLLDRGECDLPRVMPPVKRLASSSDEAPFPLLGRAGHDVTLADLYDAISNAWARSCRA